MPQPDATIGQFATGPVLEEVMLDPQGEPIDLSGATVTFVMAPRNRAIAAISKPAVIQTPAPSGVVQYLWQSGDTATAGLWDYCWLVVLPGGETVQVPTDPRRKYRTLLIIKRLT